MDGTGHKRQVRKERNTMTGYVYVGFQNKRTKHGTFKIGETGKSPKIRESQIKRSECYKMVDWITIPNADKPTLWLIESLVRFELNKYTEFTHIGNDHFQYEITNRLDDIERIRRIAITTAIKACEQYGIKYEYTRAD